MNRFRQTFDKIILSLKSVMRSVQIRSNRSYIKTALLTIPADGHAPVKEYAPVSKQKNVITKGTKITGTITTSSDTDIAGFIEGDVDCKANLNVSGKIHGNIRCNSARVENADIQGDMNIAGSLVVKIGSSIIGKIDAENVDISGKVQGNVTGKALVRIYKDACVFGDINSQGIHIESGAALKGNIEVLNDHGTMEDVSETVLAYGAELFNKPADKKEAGV